MGNFFTFKKMLFVKNKRNNVLIFKPRVYLFIYEFVDHSQCKNEEISL